MKKYIIGVKKVDSSKFPYCKPGTILKPVYTTADLSYQKFAELMNIYNLSHTALKQDKIVDWLFSYNEVLKDYPCCLLATKRGRKRVIQSLAAIRYGFL